jgi:6-pyruvoyltetrahydropterin/6-carboxytetrahydropterin synthase
MPYRDRIEVVFDAGHRLLDYEGKCASPHGHTFRAEVVVEGPEIDALGLLVDFGEVKSIVKDWINAQWDHGFLLNGDDEVLIAALNQVPEAKTYVFHGRNPSAETMARELHCVVNAALPRFQTTVRIWESSAQYAEYVEGPQ